MSQTILEKLLNGAEVEWKTLGEVCNLKRGRVISKQYLAERSGRYPVYSSQTANQGKIGTLDTYDFDGEFINWTTDGANAGTVFYRNGKFSLTNVSGLINVINNSILNCKYLFYWLTIEAKCHVYTGMGNPKLMSHQVKAIPIPIPPLSVQKEIVGILDAFTAHTAELTAELNERKKQYNYYRDKLLTFSDDEVEWKTVEEIVTTVTPPLKIPRGKYKLSGNIPIVDQGENFIAGYTDNADAAIPEGEYVIFGDHTEYIKYVDFSFAQGADGLKILKPNRDLAKYVYYAFLNFYNKTGHYKRHWTDAKKILLPIVSIKAQKRIVSILDKFDALTTSISEGLPREIELRNKQYEYYRDQVLNFTKPDLEN